MSPWQDLVTASLIGTERTAVPPAAVPGMPAAAGAPDDPAALLLDRAALLTAARRGGRPPERADPPPAAEPDPAPAVSPAAGLRLARMLRGEHPDLLTEWLTAAVARGRRAPAHLLPPLLDRARLSPADTELRRLAAEAGGTRARWLAGLNPDWKFAMAHAPADDDAWRLGDAGQRRGYLTALRARDPGAARRLIAGTWDAAAPGERIMFVKVMAAVPSLTDEPLLEAALDDPTAWVRKMAADVLAALPGSALAQRMTGRALGCLCLHHGMSGPRLIVTPPAECDAAMRRDGIAPGPAAGRSQLAGLAHLMAEVLAGTPLRTWTREFGLTAGQLAAVPSDGWAPVLFAGWSRAAMAQRDQEWMAALIGWTLADGPPADIEMLRQLVRRVDPAFAASGITVGQLSGLSPAIKDAIRVLRFRHDMLKELDVDNSPS